MNEVARELMKNDTSHKTLRTLITLFPNLCVSGGGSCCFRAVELRQEIWAFSK